MPKISHNSRGNKPPMLQILKSERVSLSAAAGVCEDIGKSVAGYLPELATEAEQVAKGLRRLAEIQELDLTKPF